MKNKIDTHTIRMCVWTSPFFNKFYFLEIFILEKIKSKQNNRSKI